MIMSKAAFTEQQLTSLIQLYDSGMNGVGIEHSGTINTAKLITGLTEEQIKVLARGFVGTFL